MLCGRRESPNLPAPPRVGNKGRSLVEGTQEHGQGSHGRVSGVG